MYIIFINIHGSRFEGDQMSRVVRLGGWVLGVQVCAFGHGLRELA